VTGKIITFTLVIVAFALGSVFGPKFISKPNESGLDSVNPPSEKKVLYWVAPMDPNYKRDQPGKSPMGMDLVPVYEDASGGGDLVAIDPTVVNSLGVRTEKAKVRPLWRRIEATGYVGLDETRISHINTRVSGWIGSLSVDAEGEQVKKGDLLFEIYSPELVNAQKEYLQARQHKETRLLQGAKEKLKALGMIPSDIEALDKTGTASENIKIIAPQNGVITSLNVREGMYIQPNTQIMSLADLSSVWLQAEVFESQAEWVAKGQAAEATLEYLPGTVLSGQVDYVYPILDPVTRTLRVRLRFENPDEILKPNMYARVSIYGRLKPNALSIPREALIPAPGRDRVVVAVGEGKFEVHEVMAGLESGDFVEIVAGISEGDEVVTSSQFLIDSEASLAGSLRRLDSSAQALQQRDLGEVFASGWVDGIDPGERRIRVSHGPIDALGWPSMTMVFDVKPSVNLAGITVGQNIRFALTQEHAGEYVMAEIYSGEKELETATDTESQESMDSLTASASQDQEDKSRVMAGAVVRGLDPEGSKITLSHDPIAELGWPAMTMDFNVDRSVPLSQIREGQNIHFSMVKEPDGGWVIDQIHVMEAAPAHEDIHDD